MEESRRLQATLKKVENIFERVYRIKAKERAEKKKELEDKGIDVEKNYHLLPKAWGDTTQTDYTGMMKAFVRDVHEETGYVDMRKIKDYFEQNIERRVESYFQGNLKEASNIKTLIAAVKAFNFGASRTKEFSKNPDKREAFVIPNVDRIQKELKEDNVFRYSKATSVLTPKPSETKEVFENIRTQGHGMKPSDPYNMRTIAYHVSKIQEAASGRISNTINLKVEHIKEIKDGKIIFHKDKGRLSREVVEVKIDKETQRFVERSIQGKNDGDRLFVGKRKDGTFLSIKDTRKRVSTIVKNAGAHLTREVDITVKDRQGNKKSVTITKSFSTHSFRKGFALNRVVMYLDKFKTREAAEQYIRERSRDNPKIWNKYKREINRLNRDRNTPREMTRLEMSYYMTSVDLGHFRLGIVENYYAPPEMVLEHYKETHGADYKGFPDETKRGR